MLVTAAWQDQSNNCVISSAGKKSSCHIRQFNSHTVTQLIHERKSKGRSKAKHTIKTHKTKIQSLTKMYKNLPKATSPELARSLACRTNKHRHKQKKNNVRDNCCTVILNKAVRHTSTHAQTHTHTHRHTCARTHTHRRTDTHAHTRTHRYTHTQSQFTCTHKSTMSSQVFTNRLQTPSSDSPALEPTFTLPVTLTSTPTDYI